MKENVIQVNEGIIINVHGTVKSVMYVKNIIFGILLHVVVKKENIQRVFLDDSAITCDEIIESYDEETNTISANFNKKKVTYKTQNFYILPVFLLLTIALLIAGSIYRCLIKQQAKQKHLLQFHTTNN